MSRAASIDADLRALSSRVAALWTRARASNARR
jgi:hypothetical protein